MAESTPQETRGSATPGDDPPTLDQDRLGLALSGGGFRATLFHLGVVEQLYLSGILDQVKYLSTVSGGSVIGAWLALNWASLLRVPLGERAPVYQELIAKPLLSLVRADVRNRALRRGWLLPWAWFQSRGRNLATVLDRLIFGGRTLSALPDPALLRVSINATSMRTGKRFRFSKTEIGDYLGGYTSTADNDLPIAIAVAASAAFPPVFSPLVLRFKGPWHRWSFTTPPKLQSAEAPPGGVEALVDGGVYENIGLQAALQRCGRIIAVDAGAPEKQDFVLRGLFSRLLHPMRVVDIMMARVVGLPVHDLVTKLTAGSVKGTFIRISQSTSSIAKVQVDGVPALAAVPAGLSMESAKAVAGIRTDLDRFTDFEIRVLRFHGRSLASAATQRFIPAWVVQNRELSDVALPALDPLQLTSAARSRLAGLLAFWRGV